MITICICCGSPMATGTDRPPSGGNPNQCVPCACGIELPARDGLRQGHGWPANFPRPDSRSCTGGNGAGVHDTSTIRTGDILPCSPSGEAAGSHVAASGSLLHQGITLPPATALDLMTGAGEDGGPATTPAGGNPLYCRHSPTGTSRPAPRTDDKAQVSGNALDIPEAATHQNGGPTHEVADQSPASYGAESEGAGGNPFPSGRWT